MSRRDPDPELEFIPIEDEPPTRTAKGSAPAPAPAAPAPAAPAPAAPAPAAPAPAASAPAGPPRAVPAEAELRGGFLQRDSRGRLTGERFAALCGNEEDLLQILISLAAVLPLSGVHFYAGGGRHLLEASADGLAREMLSARLDAAEAVLAQVAARTGRPAARLLVGSRGLFVPYTADRPAFDLAGELPEGAVDRPRLLLPQLLDPPFPALTSTAVLARLGTRARLRPDREARWLLTSQRLFGTLHSRWIQAGIDFSFTWLDPAAGGDAGGLALLHLPRLRRADHEMLAGLPECELLWNPLLDPEDAEAEDAEAPPLLLAASRDLPLPRTVLRELAQTAKPLIFREKGPPLQLEGPVPLLRGEALLRAELGPPPELARPAKKEAPPLRLPLRLLRRGQGWEKRTCALLFTPGDLRDLALLREHLPWAVAAEARLARFADVAFLLLSGEAAWNLPLGLPYWGDEQQGLFVARGHLPSPDVPLRILRQATAATAEELAFLSPARLWCVPRAAFAPLERSLELPPNLARIQLEVQRVLLPKEVKLPALEYLQKPTKPTTEAELKFEPVPPAARRSLLEEAQTALTGGNTEAAAILFERAGEFEQAAQLYDQLAGAAP